MSLNGSEVSFNLDRYGKPEYLNEKDSLVQVVLNALLMKKGNLPSNPNKGVDILQWLYKDNDLIQSDVIYEDLISVCGDSVINSNISELTVTNQTLNDGRQVLLVVIKIRNNTGEDDSLAIVLQKTDNHVYFNYSYLSDTVIS